MSRRWTHAGIVLATSAALMAGLWLAGTALTAQDAKTGAGKQATPKSAVKPEVAEFEKLTAEFQKLVGGLQQIELQFRSTAKPEERLQLVKKYQELAGQAQQLYPKLTPAAEKAFTADPDEAKDHTQHLVEVSAESVRGGKLADAQRILKLLLDGKVDNGQIRSLAAMAAFSAGDNAATQEHLKKAVVNGQPTADAKLIAEEMKTREAEAKANDLPRVKLETSKGDIVLELFENEAPNTVANFISLVEKGFYDKLVFHRVIDGFMAQGGDPKGNGSGGPGYSVPCECYAPNHRNHFFGSLAMAHAGKDTGGSQFYLTFGPTTHLNGKHTVFGRVIEGGEVLGKLTRIQPGEPGEPDKIVKATVIRKRAHEYKPKTLPERGG